MSGLGFAIAGTRLAGGLDLAKRYWKLAVGLILGAILCWPLAHCSGERAGRAAERVAWEAQAARIALAAEQLQRAADMALSIAQTADQARITSNRQEVDNAVRDIPDQPTSARQRARACLERVRQGASPADLDASGCPASPR